jgi:hypothetical protein
LRLRVFSWEIGSTESVATATQATQSDSRRVASETLGIGLQGYYNTQAYSLVKPGVFGMAPIDPVDRLIAAWQQLCSRTEETNHVQQRRLVEKENR